MSTQKYKREKGKNLCLMGQIVIESQSLLQDKDRTVISACTVYKQTNKTSQNI